MCCLANLVRTVVQWCFAINRTNVASTQGINTPGHLNYSPFGEAYVDDVSPELKQIADDAAVTWNQYLKSSDRYDELSKTLAPLNQEFGTLADKTRSLNNEILKPGQSVERSRELIKQVDQLIEQMRNVSSKIDPIAAKMEAEAKTRSQLFNQYNEAE
jgi:uncharacterized coiled-coil DUF342 family protein